MASLEEAIQETQAVLGAIITKPKLSSKLLSKPPFRYIHDLASAVLKATGWAQGYFQGEELDAKALKADKGKKLAYLEKLVQLVDEQAGQPTGARASKIAAGQEPERTNVMLQELGADGSVGRTKELVGAIISKPKMSDKHLGRPPFRYLHDIFLGIHGATGFAAGLLEPDLMERRKDRSKEDKLAVLDAIANIGALALDSYTAASAKKMAAGAEAEATNQALQLLAIAASRGASSQEAVQAYHADAAMFAGGGAVAAEEGGGAAESGAGRRGNLQRPMTARRRPPKVKDGAAAAADNGPGQSVANPGAAGLLREGQDDDDDEGDAGAAAAGSIFGGGRGGAGGDGSGLVTGLGKHTKDILQQQASQQEQKGEEDDGAAAAGAAGGGGGIRLGSIGGRRGGGSSGASGRKAATMTLPELRDAIQRLCQSANPLGKSMDYVTEDLDDMRAELQQWRHEYRRRADAMAAELRTTETSLEPMRKRLADETQACRELEGRIATLKASISKNDERIASLVGMVVNRD